MNCDSTPDTEYYLHGTPKKSQAYFICAIRQVWDYSFYDSTSNYLYPFLHILKPTQELAGDEGYWFLSCHFHFEEYKSRSATSSLGDPFLAWASRLQTKW